MRYQYNIDASDKIDALSMQHLYNIVTTHGLSMQYRYMNAKSIQHRHNRYAIDAIDAKPSHNKESSNIHTM
jgi:hypothetical protein